MYRLRGLLHGLRFSLVLRPRVFFSFGIYLLPPRPPYVGLMCASSSLVRVIRRRESPCLIWSYKACLREKLCPQVLSRRSCSEHFLGTGKRLVGRSVFVISVYACVLGGTFF